MVLRFVLLDWPDYARLSFQGSLATPQHISGLVLRWRSVRGHRVSVSLRGSWLPDGVWQSPLSYELEVPPVPCFSMAANGSAISFGG